MEKNIAITYTGARDITFKGGEHSSDFYSVDFSFSLKKFDEDKLSVITEKDISEHIEKKEENNSNGKKIKLIDVRTSKADSIKLSNVSSEHDISKFLTKIVDFKFHKEPVIEKLIFYNVKFTEAHVIPLLNIFAKHPIKTLEIENSVLTDTWIKDFFANDDSLFRLENLTLPNNRITPNGAVFIAKFIANHTVIRTLDLSRNIISDMGAKALAEAFNIHNSPFNNSLRSLCINSNNITDEGIISFIPILQSDRAKFNFLTFRDNTFNKNIFADVEKLKVNKAHQLSTKTVELINNIKKEKIQIDTNETVGFLKIEIEKLNKNYIKLQEGADSQKNELEEIKNQMENLGVLIKDAEKRALFLQSNSSLMDFYETLLTNLTSLHSGVFSTSSGLVQPTKNWKDAVINVVLNLGSIIGVACVSAATMGVGAIIGIAVIGGVTLLSEGAIEAVRERRKIEKAGQMLDLFIGGYMDADKCNKAISFFVAQCYHQQIIKLSSRGAKDFATVWFERFRYIILKFKRSEFKDKAEQATFDNYFKSFLANHGNSKNRKIELENSLNASQSSQQEIFWMSSDILKKPGVFYIENNTQTKLFGYPDRKISDPQTYGYIYFSSKTECDQYIDKFSANKKLEQSQWKTEDKPLSFVYPPLVEYRKNDEHNNNNNNNNNKCLVEFCVKPDASKGIPKTIFLKGSFNGWLERKSPEKLEKWKMLQQNSANSNPSNFWSIQKRLRPSNSNGEKIKCHIYYEDGSNSWVPEGDDQKISINNTPELQKFTIE